MKSISRGVICAFILLTISVAAQSSGPASNGDFQYALQGATGTIQYNARLNGSTAQGQVVTSSSVPAFVGVRAILAVEDNGEGKKEGRDRFTWGVDRNNARNWTPADAEVPGDNGAFLTWYATDAERQDDVAVLQNGAPTSSVDCKSFPLGSYAFEELPHGAGNIQVKP